MFENLISKDTLNTLQERQNYMNNIINNILEQEQEQESQENINKTLEDFKNELFPILNNLNSISVDGYPYILKKAHDEVVIKQRDMDSIMKELGIFEKTGRDMLE